MIVLKVVSSGPYIDPRFLDITEVPFVILVIACLFIAYYKFKKRQSNQLTQTNSNSVGKYSLENYDILMQPKNTEYNDHITFVNFSLRGMYKGLILLVVAIIIVLSVRFGFIPY